MRLIMPAGAWVQVMGDDGQGAYTNIIAGLQYVQQDVSTNR